MHAAAQWTALSCLNTGGTVVLHDDSQPFDARSILETIERERVTLVSLVGEAYARPLIEELRRGHYDLSSLTTVGIGGAATSDESKAALVALVPHLVLIDGYGSSETGGMAFGVRTRATTSVGFSPGAGAAVVSADRTRFLAPGDGEIGWVARGGHLPLGYLDDQAKTEATFPVVEGRRVSVPGDRARLGPDGEILLLGRDSMVVNTGGEKVFVEEVEAALLQHPEVVDALVVGRPSERFGEEVTALVQLRDGADVAPAMLREHVAGSIARFKAPRAVAVCEVVRRHPSGKADYRWAKEAAAGAIRC